MKRITTLTLGELRAHMERDVFQLESNTSLNLVTCSMPGLVEIFDTDRQVVPTREIIYGSFIGDNIDKKVYPDGKILYCFEWSPEEEEFVDYQTRRERCGPL